MANQKHLAILRQGVETWYQWRKEHTEIRPDLSETRLNGAVLNYFDLSWAILNGADLNGANLSETSLSGADLISASLISANLSGAYLINADLSGAYLINANLSRANLSEADLSEANLSRANLSRANLSGANLSRATLIGTNFAEATLTNCKIYGISAWSVELKGATQNNLEITPSNEPTITVDNLNIAQFIYLLLNNAEIREVIDTIAKKAVLILGRFTPERKAVLDALKDELRTHGYLPILFDFDKPASRDITETIATLAHLARFVIADITDAKSIPQELMAIVPNLPSVAVQPLILNSQDEYGMFEHFTKFPWVLPVYRYTDEISLLQSIQENVIVPAEKMAQELEKR
jgi:uncharacterized protein YjbI with pentapeptide repeats